MNEKKTAYFSLGMHPCQQICNDKKSPCCIQKLNGHPRSGDFRVKICIQKRLLWEMAVYVLFDQSEIDAVTKVINDLGLSWQSNILRHEVTSLHPDNKYLETINKGHAQKYALTGENFVVEIC